MSKKNQRKKLVVVTHSYFPVIGGVETFIAHYISKLDTSNYDIDIFTADKNLDRPQTMYQHEGITVHVMKSFTISGIVLPASLSNLRSLIGHLRSADYVHQHDIKFLSTLLVVLKCFFSYKLLLFSHGYMYHSKRFPLIKNGFMTYFSVLSKWYTRVINVSVSDAAIAKKFNFRNTVFIKEAVDLTAFASNAKAPVKNSYLYFGRLAKNKGLEHLFQCLATIPFVPYNLVIAGNGEAAYVRELQQMAQRLGIANRISWAHNVAKEQLLEHISKAEIIFLPSVYEGFGISLLESIASRSRVMAQCNDAYTAILSDLSLTHYLFDFTKPDLFEDKLKSIINNEPDACSKLQMYDHDFMVKQIEQAHL